MSIVSPAIQPGISKNAFKNNQRTLLPLLHSALVSVNGKQVVRCISNQETIYLAEREVGKAEKVQRYYIVTAN